MKGDDIIYFRKNKSITFGFSNCELSKETIDFLEGKWILDGMDAYCNAIHFFNSNKINMRFAMGHMECLRTLMYYSVLYNTDINQLLSLYTYEHPFT